ncbi:hypothetical protein [Clostridium botulinum]|uniref:hypothetical protein n=1 Tax=Clostridium botulinum TaxID=1491 RepID=UPI0021AE527F|nr:hypothetical protein [Clostridium botulinum]
MDDKNLDAIFVASPSGFHCKQIKRSLDTGFHVFSGLYLLRCYGLQPVKTSPSFLKVIVVDCS